MKKEVIYKCIKCNKTYTEQENNLRDRKHGHLNIFVNGYRDCRGKIVKVVK